MSSFIIIRLILLGLCLLHNHVEASFGKFRQRSSHNRRHDLPPPSKEHNYTSLRYYDHKTKRIINLSQLTRYTLTVIAFFIESLPDVSFDLGEIYSGLVPIDYANTSEALFFVFQPKLGEPVDEITIWLNV